jgi:hypothetical protein
MLHVGGAQIIAEMGLGGGHVRCGISKRALETWIASRGG